MDIFLWHLPQMDLYKTIKQIDKQKQQKQYILTLKYF